jgi:hypothetical protein
MGAITFVEADALDGGSGRAVMPKGIAAGSVTAWPLARLGEYFLVHWERCEPGSGYGRVGLAVVLLPGRKFGRFMIYNSATQFAETWPTNYMSPDLQAELRERVAASSTVIELVRLIDPDVLRPRGVFPLKPTGEGE